MKKHISTIIIVLFFLVGLSVLLYPTVSNYINVKNQSYAISEYNDEIGNMTEEDFNVYFKLAKEYNQSLVDVPSAFYNPDLVTGYNETLVTPKTQMMGFIAIPKINIKFPIYHGTSETILQHSIGHMEGTSLPIGGKNTHSVLVGHRGLPSAKLFTDLDKVKIGDKFTITVLNQLITYQVDQILTVLPDETDELLIKENGDYCTLVTCTPYGINSHRLLVRGVRVENDETLPEVKKETLLDVIKGDVPVDMTLVFVFGTAGILVIVLLIVLFRRKNRGMKNEKEIES